MSDTHIRECKPYIQKVYFKKTIFTREQAVALTNTISRGSRGSPSECIRFCNSSEYYIGIIKTIPWEYESKKIIRVSKGLLALIYRI